MYVKKNKVIKKMIFHKGKYIQRGRGIGSIFAGLLRKVIPAAKFFSSKILASPVTKSITETAKQSAAKAGLKLAHDILSGENVGQSLKKGMKEVSSDIIDTAKTKMSGGGRKRKQQCAKKACSKKTRLFSDTKHKIFDDIFDQ